MLSVPIGMKCFHIFITTHTYLSIIHRSYCLLIPKVTRRSPSFHNNMTTWTQIHQEENLFTISFSFSIRIETSTSIYDWLTKIPICSNSCCVLSRAFSWARALTMDQNNNYSCQSNSKTDAKNLHERYPLIQPILSINNRFVVSVFKCFRIVCLTYVKHSGVARVHHHALVQLSGHKSTSRFNPAY